MNSNLERKDIYDVFISFSKKEKNLAEKFYKKLTAAGKSAFFYVESQNPGDNYVQRINDALHGSKDFLLICTVNSAASPQVRKECETFNKLYKNALGTENERRIFIFEGSNFEGSYVPDIEDWDKIHRCNNFNKQVEALGIEKKTNSFLRWLIGGLIIVLAVVGGIYLFLPPPVIVNCENKLVEFSQDTITIEENKDSTINLMDYVKYSGFEKNENIKWGKNGVPTTEFKPICVRKNSGNYVITVADSRCELNAAVVLQIMEVKDTLQSKSEDNNEKELQKLCSKFYSYLEDNLFQKAENALNGLKTHKDYSKLREEFGTKLEKYIENNFIDKEKFGNNYITKKKDAGWGVRDKYGNAKVPYSYKSLVSNNKTTVTFLDNDYQEICYDDKFLKTTCENK